MNSGFTLTGEPLFFWLTQGGVDSFGYAECLYVILRPVTSRQYPAFREIDVIRPIQHRAT